MITQDLQRGIRLEKAAAIVGAKLLALLLVLARSICLILAGSSLLDR